VRTVALDPKSIVVTNGFWFGDTPLREDVKGAEQWIDEPGETVKLFRFSVSTGSGDASVLYQPAVYPIAFKARLRDYLRVYGPRVSAAKTVIF